MHSKEQEIVDVKMKGYTDIINRQNATEKNVKNMDCEVCLLSIHIKNSIRSPLLNLLRTLKPERRTPNFDTILDTSVHFTLNF